ncbi:hypothetical protein ACKXGD_19050, partial [Enterococcus lactis]|uniref:hypothetical protein n=1 Tax=Enterococcus lactis TaxID=357441 RepID=UPI0039083B78
CLLRLIVFYGFIDIGVVLYFFQLDYGSFCLGLVIFGFLVIFVFIVAFFFSLIVLLFRRHDF